MMGKRIVKMHGGTALQRSGHATRIIPKGDYADPIALSEMVNDNRHNADTGSGAEDRYDPYAD